jgi:hypothetical protein
MSERVTLIFFATLAGAFDRIHVADSSANGSGAESVSTGTTTLNPRNDAALAV